MTSPPERVPSDRHTPRSMLLLAKLTEPSPIMTWTPPMWRLEADTCMAMFVIVPGNPVPAHDRELGTSTWLYCVQQFSPMTQLYPHLLVSGNAVAGLRPRQVVSVLRSDVWW